MLPTDFIPKIFTTLREDYGFSKFKTDTIAGLTVAIVALPLSMALAIASGASPDKGLITAVVAGFLISFLGGSRVQVGGPTGAFVVVVFNVIAQHGYDGLVLATLLAGIILVVSGYARLGQVIKFIPYPVVTGFTAGIALIIASSQVKDFLGLTMENVPADFLHKWVAYFQHFSTIDINTLSVGVGALAVIIGCRVFLPKVPGYLAAVVLASALVAIVHLPVETIGTRFPDISSGLTLPSMPEFSMQKLKEVVPSAFIIAFLAGIEALLSAVVADGMTGYKHRSNQELIGQGVANIASAFFGGLPATGAIARTATNIKAGGKTPMAGMIHALFILLFMLFAMDIVAYIPMAALAAILFMVAWGMSEIHHFIHIFKISETDRNVLLLTFLLTVLVDLTVAIGVGVTLASLVFMRQMSRTVNISSQNNASPAAGKAQEETDEDQRSDLPEGVEVFRISGPVFFGVAGDLVDILRRIGKVPNTLILRMLLVPYLDATGVSALKKVVQECHANGTRVIFSALQSQPKKLLMNGGIADDNESVFFTEDYNRALLLSKKLAKTDS